MIYNRFNVLNVIILSMLTFVVVYVLWPTCIGNICMSVLWGRNPQEDFYSLFLFFPIFLPILFIGMRGIIKYSLGYGMGKFGQSSKYSKNASKDSRNQLLYSSLFAVLVSLLLISILVWDLIILRRMI